MTKITKPERAKTPSITNKENKEIIKKSRLINEAEKRAKRKIRKNLRVSNNKRERRRLEE